MDRKDISAATASIRQFGCGINGGAEAIIHFRKLIMQMWKNGDLKEPLCIIDIDQQNFFGSLNWKGIRAAVRDEMLWSIILQLIH